MCTSLTQGLATKLTQISILVIYDCRNVNNCIKESAYAYLSNQTAHGWFSAIPALKRHHNRIKQDLDTKWIEFKSSVMYSDGGSSDVWCAPFVACPCDLSTEYDSSI